MNGEYFMPIQEGDYTITPQLENPDYFSIAPTSFTVSFPTDVSPFIQDFCALPIGTFNDLEIVIVPIDIMSRNTKVEIAKREGKDTPKGADYMSSSPAAAYDNSRNQRNIDAR